LRVARDAYITRLNGIYERNLANRKVELVRGHAAFAGPNEVRVGDRLLEAPHVVIATGGRPSVPPIPGAGHGITSDGFFELAERPRRIAVVGSGYIAVELAGSATACARSWKGTASPSSTMPRRVRWSAMRTVRCACCCRTGASQVRSTRCCGPSAASPPSRALGWRALA
jgi:hypothetical protein